MSIYANKIKKYLIKQNAFDVIAKEIFNFKYALK